ncbi:acetoacetate--CoA ligase [Blastococcus sp. CT_GayMR20]|uniref:acetoacetate--CoA ligase n=1 Tax=Blastococcus sp. CT_GayMR20 TaxID=2559609 RepID=UPI0010743F17|nr:acetoacetate--CoA ligase [Blastococcus sp. CT_GayMR20]TFV88703.1 acetoacetate--CoA ligase [Blastococcus sp. CT_GayMR20]TFV88720.1 acetoacetate--CoA ligase [Blastococcus sp. CT_GayMR20]
MASSLADGTATSGAVREGDLLWTPSPERARQTRLADFTRFAEQRTGRPFPEYADLWAWSTTELEAFWQAVWDYFDVRSSAPHTAVLADRAMPGARWFPGARLNFAEHVLRQERPGQPALLAVGEATPLRELPWEEFTRQVRAVATHLREQGVRPGERVVAYLPNVPEAVVAMVATASVGGVWASVSPDFGSRGALDRLGQLEPAVLFTADGYRYGGRDFDRRGEAAELVAGLPSLREVVQVPVLGLEAPGTPWEDVLAGPSVPAGEFVCEQVPFDHPLWVLFSSGTTGLPKAIVHGHGGILLEQFKLQAFHLDLREGDRAFFFTTTGWMMWNFCVSMLLLGVVPVLYDGNPSHPDVDILWRTAQDSRARLFGASPTFVELMQKAGVVPRERFDLAALEIVMPAGSPVSPAITTWFYDDVKADLWIATGSGGTDCCTGFVGGVPTLPVRAGEIQARSLGVAAEAWDDAGQPVVGQVGELVITQPMPSMPLFFWGDDDGSRYRGSYFETFPGVWRHGDFFELNERGGCFVRGRSDAVLNRQGVRIGTAEIYRVVEDDPAVLGALIVNLDLPGGGFFMPLFVSLAPGAVLDEELTARLRRRLREEYTPRHVPDRIVAVGSIPLTRSGKKMEIPVRRLLLGADPAAVADPNAMADPAALADFVEYARTQSDYTL